MADRDRISAICHGDLPFHDPLDPRRIDEAVDLLGLAPGDRVLDVGCGPGELLVRLAERTGCGGTGVDASRLVVEEARRRAAARVPDAGLEFVAGDAAVALDEVGGDLAAACCLGATHALGGLDATLATLAAHVRPGGSVLLADGFWQREPAPELLDALGATRDELPDLAGLLGAGAAHDLAPVWLATSTAADWERYEWSLISTGDAFCRAHPGDPDVADVRAWVDRARDRVLGPGGTGTIGFALVLLRAGAGDGVHHP